jgi:hypothetical protein
MTDADQIRQLRSDKRSLMRLLKTAIAEMPEPHRGRQPGDPIDWRYAGERPVQRLLRAIDGGRS